MLIPFTSLYSKYKPQITGILHVGAHECEEESDYHKHGFKKIIWLEALQEKVDKFPDKNIYQIVVDSDDNKDVIFNITNNFQSSSIYELDEHAIEHPTIHVIEKRNMTTKRIDTLFNEKSIPTDFANFINLDIQGNELNALKSLGDIINNINYIYTEVNTKYLYKNCCLLNEIDNYLTDFTRVETKMTKHGWGDAFYIRKTK